MSDLNRVVIKHTETENKDVDLKALGTGKVFMFVASKVGKGLSQYPCCKISDFERATASNMSEAREKLRKIIEGKGLGWESWIIERDIHTERVYLKYN